MINCKRGTLKEKGGGYKQKFMQMKKPDWQPCEMLVHGNVSYKFCKAYQILAP
jgi:hypothetical protein